MDIEDCIEDLKASVDELIQCEKDVRHAVDMRDEAKRDVSELSKQVESHADFSN